MLKIAKSAGIKAVRNTDVRILNRNENGASLYSGGKWYIVYDDRKDTWSKRFTVAHELGHIFLGHPLHDGYYSRRFSSKTASENEANDFAMRLLCPACVLWKLGLFDGEEIAKVCAVPKKEAEKRAARMKKLNKRGAYLTHSLERELYENFREYIESKLSDG